MLVRDCKAGPALTATLPAAEAIAATPKASVTFLVVWGFIELEFANTGDTCHNILVEHNLTGH